MTEMVKEEPLIGPEDYAEPEVKLEEIHDTKLEDFDGSGSRGLTYYTINNCTPNCQNIVLNDLSKWRGRYIYT